MECTRTEPEPDQSAGGFHYVPPTPLSRRALGELSSVGITPDDYAWFVDRFVGHGFDYIERGLAAPCWHLVAFPLTGRAVADHLLGHRWIGTGARIDRTRGSAAWSRFVLIDLDKKGDDAIAQADLLDRHRRVESALGPCTFAMRSSKSGGRHLYYLLREPAPLYPLRDLKGTSGLLLDLLAAAGIPEGKGRVEVYPRGQGSRVDGPQNRVRLPFGIGSAVLRPGGGLAHHHSAAGDADIEARVADLRWVRTWLESGALRTVDVAEWEAKRPATVPAAIVPEPVQRSVQQVEKVKRPLESCDSPLQRDRIPGWWAHGLGGPSERHSATFSLMFDIWKRWRDEPREDAERAAADKVWSWLVAKHNGHAQMLQDDPEEARAEVERLARDWFAQHPKSQFRPLMPLTLTEARAVLAVADVFGSGPTLRTGRFDVPTVPRLKFVRYLWLRTMLAKAWLYTEADKEWVKVIEARGPISDSDRLAAAFVAETRRWWPDSQAPVFVVDQPYQKFRNLKRAPSHPLLRRIAAPMWPVLKQMAEVSGAFVRVRRRDTIHRLSESFRTPLLSFGAYDAGDARLFERPELAIAALLTPVQITDLYAARGRKKVAEEEGAAVASGGLGSPSPGIEVIRAHLTATTPSAVASRAA